MYKITLMPTDFCQIGFSPRADCKNRDFFLFFLFFCQSYKAQFSEEENETFGLSLRMV